jgi:hypothetical protein
MRGEKDEIEECGAVEKILPRIYADERGSEPIFTTETRRHGGQQMLNAES